MIIVYGRKQGCVQCEYTCKFLDNAEIPYQFIDVDEVGAERLPAAMGLQLPYVVTSTDNWSGYKREKLKALTIARPNRIAKKDDYPFNNQDHE